MLKNNKELRFGAREALKGNWGTAIGVFIVLSLISLGTAIALGWIPIIGGLVSLAIGAAIQLGFIIFGINLLNVKEANFEDGFKGFNNILKAFGAVALVSLFTMLWTLLLIIPGIIKSFSYSQTLYILAENPDMKILDAITKSRKLMDGAKMKLFLLQLSFIGWGILCIFTLGIGYLWLAPYMAISLAAFYIDLKNNDENLGSDEVLDNSNDENADNDKVLDNENEEVTDNGTVDTTDNTFEV